MLTLRSVPRAVLLRRRRRALQRRGGATGRRHVRHSGGEAQGRGSFRRLIAPSRWGGSGSARCALRCPRVLHARRARPSTPPLRRPARAPRALGAAWAAETRRGVASGVVFARSGQTRCHQCVCPLRLCAATTRRAPAARGPPAASRAAPCSSSCPAESAAAPCPSRPSPPAEAGSRCAQPPAPCRTAAHTPGSAATQPAFRAREEASASTRWHMTHGWRAISSTASSATATRRVGGSLLSRRASSAQACGSSGPGCGAPMGAPKPECAGEGASACSTAARSATHAPERSA